MQSETDGLLLAVDDWLAGWFVSGDSDESGTDQGFSSSFEH